MGVAGIRPSRTKTPRTETLLKIATQDESLPTPLLGHSRNRSDGGKLFE